MPGVPSLSSCGHSGREIREKCHLKILCLGDSVQTRVSNELERVSHHTWASSLWGMPGRGRRAPAFISSLASGGTGSLAASF